MSPIGMSTTSYTIPWLLTTEKFTMWESPQEKPSSSPPAFVYVPFAVMLISMILCFVCFRRSKNRRVVTTTFTTRLVPAPAVYVSPSQLNTRHTVLDQRSVSLVVVPVPVNPASGASIPVSSMQETSSKLNFNEAPPSYENIMLNTPTEGFY